MSSERTSTLIVTSTLDKLHIGDTFDHLPSHVTFFPPFDLPDSNLDLFDQDMREIAEQHAAVMPEGGSKVMFGDDESVSARRFDRPSPLFNVLRYFPIHAAIYRSVNELGGQYDPTYVGLDFAPHISDSPDRVVEEGETIVLDNLTVFKKDAERRKKIVTAVYLLDQIHG